jgi:hypothetical protein
MRSVFKNDLNDGTFGNYCHLLNTISFTFHKNDHNNIIFHSNIIYKKNLQISRYSLKDLDLLGQDMSYVPLQEIGVLKNLRTLGLAAVKDFGQVIE